ncbi:MAG: hypothetical protein ACRDNE_17855 [Gaiellaceae bacterium]
MIGFVRYAILLLAGLALIVAWTSVDWDGPERPGVPAIELSPRERDGGQRPRRTDAGRSERHETRGASTDPGGGAAPAPAPQPAPAGDDDEPDDAEEPEDGDDGDDGGD